MCPTIISASCIHLIITSMGHLVCCYLSALIDCLPKFRRVGCVCLFCLTNGHHLSTHLRAKLRAGSRGATAIENRSTCLDERHIHQRLINKKTSSMPFMKDAGGENADESNYDNNYICADKISLIRRKKRGEKNGFELESDIGCVLKSPNHCS